MDGADAELAALGLEHYDAGDDPALSFVRHGENTTYRVDGARGAWALRVHRPGYRSADEVRSEVAWMEALQTAGIRTPTAVRTVQGDVVAELATDAGPRLVSAMTWEPGEPLSDADDAAAWRGLGELMGRVREHGKAWQPPERFRRWAWDAQGMLGPDPHWGDPALLPDWDAEALAVLNAVRDRVRARLAAFGDGPDRWGLVHGDLAFHNVLVGEGGTVLIDFDDAGWSWWMWELGVALAPFDGRPGFADRRDALVAGYRSACDVSEDELAELPTFVMARRLVTLGWVLTHAETQHAQAQRAWRIATFPDAARAYLAATA